MISIVKINEMTTGFNRCRLHHQILVDIHQTSVWTSCLIENVVVGHSGVRLNILRDNDKDWLVYEIVTS